MEYVLRQKGALSVYNLSLEVYFFWKGLAVSTERAGLAHMTKCAPTTTTLRFAYTLE